MGKLDQREITLTVARHVVDKVGMLEGELSAPHFFKVTGKSISDRSYSNSRVLSGYAVDILADLIEKDEFFGWYIDRDSNMANMSGNATVIPLYKAGRVTFEGANFRETKAGLLVTVPEVAEKIYLGGLKNPDDFKKYSEIVNLAEKIPQEEILSRINKLFTL